MIGQDIFFSLSFLKILSRLLSFPGLNQDYVKKN